MKVFNFALGLSAMMFLATCQGNHSKSRVKNDLIGTPQTMSVVIKGVTGGVPVTVQSIFLGSDSTAKNYIVYTCKTDICSFNTSADNSLALNEAISSDASGRLFINTCGSSSSAETCISEVKPVTENSWYTKAGVYVLPKGMGYQQTLFLRYDGANWTYSASVTH